MKVSRSLTGLCIAAVLSLGLIGELAHAAPSDGGVTAAPVAAAPAVENVVAAVKGVVDSSDSSRALAIAGLLAVLLRFAMALVGPRVAWFARHPHAYRWTALGVGVAVFALEKFAMGTTWQMALIAAGGGPGAVLVNEILKMKPTAAAPAVPPVG